MPEVPPDLAEKVFSADLRNLIKKIGDGCPLSSSERQMFIHFTNSTEDPDALHQARINSLLKKWLHGSRLTKEERAEIAHIIPDKPPPEKAYTGSPAEVAASLGLHRRVFFRWQAYGREHNDPLPCHDPPSVPAWFDRMKARGVFKHRLMKSVEQACKKASPGPPVNQGQKSGSTNPPSTIRAPQSNDFINRNAETRGLAVEIEALEKRVAALREASDAAYASGDIDQGDQLRERFNTEFEKLRKIKKDAPKVLADDAEITRRQWVEEDLASIFPSVIATWINEGQRFHRDCQSTLPRHDFMRLWHRTVSDVCRALAKSKFAPPLTLSAA